MTENNESMDLLHYYTCDQCLLHQKPPILPEPHTEVRLLTATDQLLITMLRAVSSEIHIGVHLQG